MIQAASSNRTSKTALTTAVVVVSNVAGNFWLSYGMKQVGEPTSALAFLAAFLNPWVLTGVVLLILWMLSHMALLSWADLSYVLPITSIGYVLTALSGRFFMHEVISPARWGGILLITLGVLLVGRTPESTIIETPSKDPAC